jgi:NAD(P)H-hydrate epimerase
MRPAFVTEDGIEVPSVTAAEMREIDRIAVEETGPNLFQMMENPGRGLAKLALELLGRGWRGVGAGAVRARWQWRRVRGRVRWHWVRG